MRRLPLVLLALLVVVLARTAWLCDDALITLRSVVHWQDGWGLRWNVGERVQVFTHPLWMLLLAGATGLTGELFRSTLALAAACSLAALGLLARQLRETPGRAALVLAVLLGSKAWVDFASGGLENPLAYLLLVLLVGAAGRAASGRSLAAVVGLGSLVFLTRMDLALLAAPLVLHATWRCPGRARRAKAWALGALPALAWLAFATWYFGFPLPNTAYAKLGAGIPGGELVTQGARYLLDSLGRGPLTRAATGGALALALARGDARARALALGTLAYLAYVLRIGGDFMSGRFLAVPLLAALLAAAPGPALPPRRAGALVALALGLGLLAHGPNLLAGADYADRWPASIAPPGLIVDERAYYWERFGWLAEDRPPYPAVLRQPWRPGALPEAVVVESTVGFEGLRRGPGVHVVDRMALTDPLLARLPARRDLFQRIGHFERLLPRGYLRSLFEGEVHLADPALAAYARKLWVATRAPLGAPGRLGALLDLNRGTWDHLVVAANYREASHPRVEGEVPRAAGLDTRPPRASDTPLDPARDLIYGPAVDLMLSAPVAGPRLGDRSLERDDPLLLRFYRGEREVGQLEAQAIPQGDPGALRRLRMVLPRKLHGATVDRVRAQLLHGHGPGALGHLRVQAGYD